MGNGEIGNGEMGNGEMGNGEVGRHETKDLQDQDQDRDSRHQDQDQNFENWVSRCLETKTQVSRTPSLLLCTGTLITIRAINSRLTE